MPYIGAGSVKQDKLQSLLKMESSSYNIMKKSIQNFFSEMTGTAILVFLGCMGLCKGLDQTADHTGAVLSFSLAVFIAAQVAAYNSGGHVNPAVTVLGLFFRKINIYMAIIYISGQVVGGVVGFGLLKAITPSDLIDKNGYEKHGLCTTMPNPQLSLAQAFFTEFLLTAVLLLIVCTAWDPRNGHHDSLTLKFGFTVYTLAYAGVAYSGCSMNPARSFGPAVWNGAWENHWIYWVGPLSASVFCGLMYTTFFCPSLKESELPTLRVTKSKDEVELGSS